MASSAAPYGFRPVNLIGGQPYAGSTRQIKIASGYGTNLFNGHIVSIVAAGTIELVTTNGDNSTGFPAGTIGVFVGCSYTDPNTSQKVFAQYWPASTVASDAVAYVVDDPDVLLQVQADGGGWSNTIESTDIHEVVLDSARDGVTDWFFIGRTGYNGFSNNFELRLRPSSGSAQT